MRDRRLTGSTDHRRGAESSGEGRQAILGALWTLAALGLLCGGAVGGWIAAFFAANLPAYPLAPVLLVIVLLGCCVLIRRRWLLLAAVVGGVLGAAAATALLVVGGWAVQNF